MSTQRFIVALSYVCLCLFGVFANGGCADTPRQVPVLREVAGKYTGDYADGTETLLISANGHFHQTFVRKGKLVYKSKGEWAIVAYDIQFSPFLSPFPSLFAEDNDQKKYPYDKVDSSLGAWCSSDHSIIFDEDNDYMLYKN